ncbi:hypothetical protein KJ359_013145 [Pestalotiopsis sp. 9143b]|nr:hypothetical protein KJ359_013145 [Pestalotiopsis sp. 9143b]
MAVSYAAAFPAILAKFNQLQSPTQKTEHIEETMDKLTNEMKLLEEEVEDREDGIPFLKREIDELEQIAVRLYIEQQHMRVASRLLHPKMIQMEQMAAKVLRMIQDIVRKGPYDHPKDRTPNDRNSNKRQRDEDTEMNDTEMANHELGTENDPNKNPKKRRIAKMRPSKRSMT